MRPCSRCWLLRLGLSLWLLLRQLNKRSSQYMRTLTASPVDARSMPSHVVDGPGNDAAAGSTHLFRCGLLYRIDDHICLCIGLAPSVLSVLRCRHSLLLIALCGRCGRRALQTAGSLTTSSACCGLLSDARPLRCGSANCRCLMHAWRRLTCMK